MSNFKDSFNKGIDLANVARNNKEEINQVFDDLNKELSELTSNKVEIVINNFSEEMEPLSATAGVIGAAIAGLEGPKYRRYQGLGARNPNRNSSIYELATWSQGRAGYPCKIKFGNKSFICEDKEGLIEALSELLEDPEAGGIFQRLMGD